MADLGASDWNTARTGQPITLNGYRGEGGKYGGLTPEQQAKFGREFLFGPGAYVAPTERLASHFGAPRPVHISLRNPYVLDAVNGGQLRALDLDQVRRDGHDGIIVKSGQWGYGAGQESLRQAIAFNQRASEGHAAPLSGALVSGATVRIKDIPDTEFTRTYRKDVLDAARQGQSGVIVGRDRIGIFNVRIGGKVYKLAEREMELAERGATRATQPIRSPRVQRTSRRSNKLSRS